MKPDDIETRLSRCGEDWPVASVVDAVAKRLDSAPRPQRVRPGWQPWRLAFVGSVSLAVACLMVWTTLLSTPSTLSAQVQAAIANARSAHVTTTLTDAQGARRKAGDLWYSREHGFRAESADQFIVDDGRQQWTWNPTLKESELVVARRASHDAASMIANSMQLGTSPASWKQTRTQERDRDIQGKRCEAYFVEPPLETVSTAVGDTRPSPLRFIAWLDPQRRVVQIEEQRQINTEWKTRRETSIEYDLEIPVEKFAVKFPPAAKIVDADGLWADRFPLEKALETIQSGGLLFAVHELSRCENDLFYVVSSVRGTREHLQKFPPQRRRLNLQTTILDVAEQTRGATVQQDHHVATLTTAELEGVQYSWWICAGRQFYQLKDGARVQVDGGARLEIEPGRIRIPLSARYRDPRAGGNLVMTLAEVRLPNAAPTQSLLEIAARVRRDALLDSEGLSLFAGIKDNTLQIVRPASTTEAEFAKGIASTVAWLRSYDEVSNLTVITPNRQPVAAGRLPAKLNGQVIGPDDKPVANAAVSVRIQRYNPYVDPTDAAAPQPLTATTDAQGRYEIASDEPLLGQHDELKIRIRAAGFADVATIDFDRQAIQGALPKQKLLAGRPVRGRLVDRQGQPVAEAVVRVHAAAADQNLLWDTGPVPVDEQGAFAMTIPQAGTAAIAIYPRKLAPQLLKIGDSTSDLGPITLTAGTSLTGRVLDRQGRGIAGTVVAIQSQEHKMVSILAVMNATAVKTDDSGKFTLPPFLGKCQVVVTDSAPDYSRQFVVTGVKPPAIPNLLIELSGTESTREIILSAN